MPGTTWIFLPPTLRHLGGEKCTKEKLRIEERKSLRQARFFLSLVTVMKENVRPGTKTSEGLIDMRAELFLDEEYSCS